MRLRLAITFTWVLSFCSLSTFVSCLGFGQQPSSWISTWRSSLIDLHEAKKPWAESDNTSEKTTWMMKTWPPPIFVPPKTYSIVFNKVEKCASSTVGGILRVIAHRRNLTADTSYSEAFLSEAEKGQQKVVNPSGQFLSDTAAETGQRWVDTLREPFILATHHARLQWGQLQQVRCVCTGDYANVRALLLLLFVMHRNVGIRLSRS